MPSKFVHHIDTYSTLVILLFAPRLILPASVNYIFLIFICHPWVPKLERVVRTHDSVFDRTTISVDGYEKEDKHSLCGSVSLLDVEQASIQTQRRVSLSHRR